MAQHNDLTIEHGGHRYEAVLSRGPEDTRTHVTIYRDDHWAGDGELSAACEIIDCAATLGDDPDATDAVYSALDNAIKDAMARGLYSEMDPTPADKED
jgi:hypothetical protein